MGQDKIYVGTGREKKGKYGPQLQISFSEKDLSTLGEYLNSNGWVTLYVQKRKEEKNGCTHYMTVAIPKDRHETSDEPAHTAEPERQPPEDESPDRDTGSQDTSDMPF